MSKVVVTGGCGFIGSALVVGLLRQGHEVSILDDLSRGHRQDLPAKCYKCDVTGVLPADPFKKAEVVIHLAAINGTKNFYDKPAKVLEVSVAGTLNVIKIAQAYGVKTFIYASSSEVYHNPSVIPTTEDVPLVIPDLSNRRFSYSGGKIAGELLTHHIGGQVFDRSMTVRPHNIYGPNAGDDHVIPTIMKYFRGVEEGTEVTVPIQGHGTETRSFCHIDDCVRGIIRVMESGSHQEVYNIGSGVETSIRDLVEMISLVFGCKVDLQPSGRTLEGSPFRRCPDVSKLKILGWKPEVSLFDGLRGMK